MLFRSLLRDCEDLFCSLLWEWHDDKVRHTKGNHWQQKHTRCLTPRLCMTVKVCSAICLGEGWARRQSTPGLLLCISMYSTHDTCSKLLSSPLHDCEGLFCNLVWGGLGSRAVHAGDDHLQLQDAALQAHILLLEVLHSACNDLLRGLCKPIHRMAAVYQQLWFHNWHQLAPLQSEMNTMWTWQIVQDKLLARLCANCGTWCCSQQSNVRLSMERLPSISSSSSTIGTN